MKRCIAKQQTVQQRVREKKCVHVHVHTHTHTQNHWDRRRLNRFCYVQCRFPKCCGRNGEEKVSYSNYFYCQGMHIHIQNTKVNASQNQFSKWMSVFHRRRKNSSLISNHGWGGGLSPDYFIRTSNNLLFLCFASSSVMVCIP